VGRWRAQRADAAYLLVDQVTYLQSQLDTRTIAGGFDVTLQSEAKRTMRVSDQFDRIEQTFTLVPGRTVAPGSYGWREATIKYEMAAGSRVLGTINSSVGDFYTGKRRSVGAGVTWQASPSLAFETRHQRNAISLATGDFVANLAGLRMRAACPTTLLGAAFVQFNTQTRSFSTNARPNWRWAPLSDVFLVCTDRRDSESWAQNERSVALKVTRMLAF